MPPSFGVRRRSQAQSQELPEAEFIERAASFWGEQIRLTESFRDQIAQLDPPPGDEEQVGQFLESIDDGLAIAREIEATLEGGDDIAASTVEEYGQAVVRGNTLAQAYGFEAARANRLGRAPTAGRLGSKAQPTERHRCTGRAGNHARRHAAPCPCSAPSAETGA